MTMRTMASSDPNRGRGRIKARIVGIGREGGGLDLVVPKRKRFIEINWWVLGEYIKWGFVGLCLFGCGIAFGLVWAWGG